ncbi:hypothetical protein LOZ58_004559 [Ophidiomyces ophidiicola]|nr:hypothetical protein LOZ58_004559 [Ophidiomyces ophidiicola]
MVSSLEYSRSHRDHFVEPPSVMERAYHSLPHAAKTVLLVLRARGDAVAAAYSRERRRVKHKRGGWALALLRLLFSLPTLMIGMWFVTLWWGERTVFRDAVDECVWDKWEKWPQDAVPHHTLFIADPQLVDAHTYPGRPWPLSSLTIYLADLYLYRTHALLQQKLRPDSTFFLGDLFDGGREWSTPHSSSPDPRFKRYGDRAWVKEYGRFVRIYLDTFKLGGTRSFASPRGRKIIASLPGNHDLGFGNGIQLPVLQRFRAYFGEGNRVDMIGNHTFASVDSVSLSAMDQEKSVAGGPATGSFASKEIWEPTETFLNDFQKLRSRAIREELLLLNGKPENYVSTHTATDATAPIVPKILPALSSGDFPTVLLTHVPLFREAGTPCGPLREHWPPSSTDPPPEKDERNAIRIGWGYQYQNVLTPRISNDIINKTGPVIQIYSGDDHDYCEIKHQEFRGAPKEITVKSASFAMGVRRPGVQLASLWNPIDPKTGKSVNPSGSTTLQNNLCLLPDQLSVLLRYAYTFAVTIIILCVHAIYMTVRGPNDACGPILPLTEPYVGDISSTSVSSKCTSSSSPSGSESRFGTRYNNIIASRAASRSPPDDAARSSKVAPSSGFSAPDENTDRSRRANWEAMEKVKEKQWSSSRAATVSKQGFPQRLLRNLVSSLQWVGGICLVWYFWLLWTW